MASENFHIISDKFKVLQEQMCALIEEADGKGNFSCDRWSKAIGGGITRVLADGQHIEKAAINFSSVSSEYTPQMEALLGEKATSYAATGISSIMHPRNSHAPIIHMNVRFFELDNGSCWFGGGIDLTPHYINVKQAKWFHNKLKSICDTYDAHFYTDFKKWADDYFFLSHRDETRGVGGIFYDRLKPSATMTFDQLQQFSCDLASAYPQIYSHLLLSNSGKPFTQKEKEWQQTRRGRYVEFNLIHDRGTKFGLASGGNTESILVSMPPNASWDYNSQPLADSNEARTLSLLTKNIDWINIEIKDPNHVG